MPEHPLNRLDVPSRRGEAGCSVPELVRREAGEPDRQDGAVEHTPAEVVVKDAAGGRHQLVPGHPMRRLAVLLLLAA